MATPIRPALTRGMSGLAGLLFAINVLIIPAASAVESATVRLQKGIFAEETEGDLDAAIRWYRALLSEETTLRVIAAQAWYRYGESWHPTCHVSTRLEKLRQGVNAISAHLPGR